MIQNDSYNGTQKVWYTKKFTQNRPQPVLILSVVFLEKFPPIKKYSQHCTGCRLTNSSCGKCSNQHILVHSPSPQMKSHSLCWVDVDWEFQCGYEENEVEGHVVVLVLCPRNSQCLQRIWCLQACVGVHNTKLLVCVMEVSMAIEAALLNHYLAYLVGLHDDPC